MEEIIKNQLYNLIKSELFEIIDKINSLVDVENGIQNKEHKAIHILILLKNYIINLLVQLDCRTESAAKKNLANKSSLLSNLSMCEFCCFGLGPEITRTFSENLVFESLNKIKCSDFKNQDSTFITKIIQTAWMLSPSQQIGEMVFEIVKIIVSNDLLNTSAKKKFLFESEVLLNQISNKYRSNSFPEIHIQ